MLTFGGLIKRQLHAVHTIRITHLHLLFEVSQSMRHACLKGRATRLA